MLLRKFSLLFLHASFTTTTLYTNRDQLECLIEIRILKTPETVTESVGKSYFVTNLESDQNFLPLHLNMKHGWHQSNTQYQFNTGQNHYRSDIRGLKNIY